MHGYGVHGILGGWGWLLIIILLTLLLWFVIRAYGKRPDKGLGSEETALNILKKRYANGEIDQDEYEEKKREILS